MKSSEPAFGSVLDPIAAYDRIAPAYARISAERRAYLDAVERLIIENIPPRSATLLDVGAGDGSRAGRIRAGANLCEVVLLEPSSVMRSLCPAGSTLWALRAEALSAREGRFDVITCLWNVLGHIFPVAARIEALRQFARLLAPEGRVFIDLNHRYNARHYGRVATLARFLRDRVAPGETNGDVTVRWNVAGKRCVTSGHVFTDREFTALARSAGLHIERRFVVDYATGGLCKRSVGGNLLYALRRAG
jgi:SAM-dependent methyltransferase